MKEKTFIKLVAFQLEQGEFGEEIHESQLSFVPLSSSFVPFSVCDLWESAKGKSEVCVQICLC